MHRFYCLRHCRPARLAALLTLLLAPGLRPAALAQFTQTQKISLTPRGEYDRWGRTVAVDGNTMAAASFDRGKIALFEKQGGTWRQTQLLLDPVAGSNFGRGLALEGNTLVVGDYQVETDADGNNPLEGAGAAYVFEKVDGTWRLTAKLVADDRAEDAFFGNDVDVSGSRIAVGAVGGDGAAYVFEKVDGTWQQTQKLTGNVGGQYDDFGRFVALSGNTLVVTAAQDENANEEDFFNAGSVYVFEKVDGTWQQFQKLVANDRQPQANFGSNVDVSGATVLVGASGEDAAYIFEKTGGTYQQTARLVAGDGPYLRETQEGLVPSSIFGAYLALDGDLALVGDYIDPRGPSGQNIESSAGSAYVFGKVGGTWQQLQKLFANDRERQANFGEAVALSGTTLVVGANGEDQDANGQNPLEAAGAVYVFEPCRGTLSAAPATSARACQNDSLAVTFAAAGCPSSLATYTVQISNAFGSFANPTTLGAVPAGTTKLALPSGLPAGTGYRVRIVSGGQASAASLPFRVEGPSLSGATPTVSGAPVCRGGEATVSFSLPEGSCPFPEGTVFTAQLSSAFGSFNNPATLGEVTPGGASSVTIPATVSAGSGYRIRVVSSNPALTSSTSSTFQVRACANRLSAEEAQLVVLPNPVSGGNAFPGEIRCRVVGMDNPAFSLTTGGGRTLILATKTDGTGEFTLTPRQRLAAGVYVLQASEGTTRLTQRVLVVE